MSLEGVWEVKVSSSALPARTFASSLSFIFIPVCFLPWNFYQSIQPSQLLTMGIGAKLTCPLSLRRTGAAVVVGQGGGVGVGGKACDIRPSLV